MSSLASFALRVDNMATRSFKTGAPPTTSWAGRPRSAYLFRTRSRNAESMRETIDDLVSRIFDGAKVVIPPDYSGVAVAATRALIRRGVRGASGWEPAGGLSSRRTGGVDHGAMSVRWKQGLAALHIALHPSRREARERRRGDRIRLRDAHPSSDHHRAGRSHPRPHSRGDTRRNRGELSSLRGGVSGLTRPQRSAASSLQILRACPAQCGSRSTFLRTLPTGVTGNGSSRNS